MQKLKQLLINATLLFSLAMPMAATATVGAQSVTDCLNGQGTAQGCLDSGSCVDGSASCADPAAAETKVNTILKLVINVFSLIVGVVSVIMIIIGGLKYITSGGDSGNVSGAKNTIMYAVIGLVVVALAQVIVRFVLSKVAQ